MSIIKIDHSATESQILKFLVDSNYFIGIHNETLRLGMTYYKIPYMVGLYVLQNVLREEIGFDKNKKPGDYDLVLLPYSIQGFIIDKILVVEAKILRSKHENKSKNVNKYGISQINGIIDDGFSNFCLMHVNISNPSPKQYYRVMKIENSNESKALDMFPFESTERHKGRLNKLNILNKCGLLLVTLSNNEEGIYFGSEEYEVFEQEQKKVNPSMIKRLIDKDIINKYCIRRFEILNQEYKNLTIAST